MKNSDKIRLILAVAIGCLAIFLMVWFRVSGTRESETGTALPAEADVGESVEDASLAASVVTAEADTEATVVAAGAGASGGMAPAKVGGDAAGSARTGASVTVAQTAQHDISGNSLYKSNTVITFAKAPAKEPQNPAGVLEEMRGYWDEVGLDALRDLWELDRYQELTAWLSAHEDIPYFYSGDQNAAGEAHGKGIAVYSGNRYYYGEWKNGKREGAGEWYQFYPERMQDVVELHEYSGTWKNDLPNGEGIDVYVYHLSRMESENYYPMHFMGNFTDGLCDGEMAVALQAPDGSVSTWGGVCKKGVWQPVDGVIDTDGKVQALYNKEKPKERISMWPEYNTGYGVYHVS